MNTAKIIVAVVLVIVCVHSAPPQSSGLQGLHIGNGPSTLTGLAGPLAPPEPFPQNAESDDIRASPAEPAKPSSTDPAAVRFQVGRVLPSAGESGSPIAPGTTLVPVRIVPAVVSSSSKDGKVAASPRDLDTAHTFFLSLGLGVPYFGGFGYGLPPPLPYY